MSQLGRRERAFMLGADLLRSLPRVRGKVRLGLWLHRRLGLLGRHLTVVRPLFRERLAFRLDLACAHERMALLMNAYEDEAVDFLAQLYTGGHILDIGANIGLVAVPLAKRTRCGYRGDGAHLLAFEALPGNHAALVENLRLNGLLEQVEAFRLGLGDEPAVVDIEVEGGDGQHTGTANVLPAGTPRRGERLEIVALDGLRADGRLPGPVTLIKIDTDGYDLQVLKGARALLASDRPLVYAELNAVCLAWHGQTLADAARFLERLDYELWPSADHRTMRFRAYRAGDPYAMDCLLVPRERALELQHLRADVR